MAREQITMSGTIAKAVAEATRVANPSHGSHRCRKTTKHDRTQDRWTAMKQPTFNWEMEDKYSKLKTFWLEVNNIVSTYNTLKAEQLQIVKNWLGRRGLQFLEMLTKKKKTTSGTLEGLFETLSSKFKPHFNETIM